VASHVKAKVLEQLEEVCGESLYCDIRELEALCGNILQNRHIHTNQVHRYTTPITLIKKKIKFASYIKKFRKSVAKSYMTYGLLIYVKYLRISSYIRKPCLIYDFATTLF
jgi:hypothetical protein